MTDKVFPMTVEGKAELEAELEELRTTKRDEVVERIKIARGYGDLSENSEYESARDEQAIIEGRIKVIENMLHNAEIIEKSDNDDEVSFGSTVTFKEVPGDEEETYTIVGKAEADPFEGKISNESPIGQALIGAKVGDQVNIASEADPFTIEILKIENK